MPSPSPRPDRRGAPSRRQVLLTGAATAMAGGVGLHLAPGAQAATSAASTAPLGPTGPAGLLYLPEVDADTIAVLDTATLRVVERIKVGPQGSRPAVMAATPDGSKLYCDNFGVFPATVTVIDRVAGSSRTLPVASVPLGAFSSPDGREIFLPEVGFRVEVMSTETDQVVRTLRFGDVPAGAIVGPDGLLYVGFVSGLIGAYDPQTGATVKKPIYSGGLATFWYSFSADGRTMFTDTVNTIGVIDLKRWKLTRTIATTGRAFGLPTEPGAFTSTLSPDGTKLYVALFGGTGVLVIDVATQKLVRTIPTRGVTTGITFSGDGSRGYISDLASGTRHQITPLGELITFTNLITVGALGPGRLVEFDPLTDQITRSVAVGAGPGISAWVPHR